MNSNNKSNPPLAYTSKPTCILKARIIFILAVIISILSTCAGIKGQSILLSRPLTMRWRYASSSLSSIPPVKDSESAYLTLTGGEIIALRIKDGQLMWKTGVGGEVSAQSSVDTESLYVANEAQAVSDAAVKESDFFLRSIGISSGVIRWLRAFPQTVQSITNSDSSTLFVVSSDGTVTSVDKKSGQLKWSSQQASRILSAPIVNNNFLYLALDKGEIVALRIEDGGATRRYRTLRHISSALLMQDGSVYLGMEGGYVSAYAEAGSTLKMSWRKHLGAEIQSLNQTSQGLLIVSRDNSVTFLNRLNGKKFWKRHLPDRLAAPPLLQEDAGLFAPVGENVCIILSLRDGKQINTLNLGESNSIVAAPVIAQNYLLVPTKLGLLAFTASE